MKRLFLGGAVAFVLLAGVTPAQAETVPLGYKEFTGPRPSVFFSPETLERAESFTVLVSANPSQNLEYEHYISCTRGPETVAAQLPTQLITPPFSTSILPTLPEPDSCWIWVSAETPFDGSKSGTIRVEITGNRRPPPAPLPSPPPAQTPSYWVACSLPAWLQSGEAKVHGDIPCSRARAIVTTAWRKPPRAGARVKSSGYSCLRYELRARATVRCTRDQTVIRVAGKLD